MKSNIKNSCKTKKLVLTISIIVIIIISLILIVLLLINFNKVTDIECNQLSECSFKVYNLGYAFPLYIYVAIFGYIPFIIIGLFISEIKAIIFHPINFIYKKLLKFRIYHLLPKYWIQKIVVLLAIIICISISMFIIYYFPFEYKFKVISYNEKKLVVIYSYHFLPYMNREKTYFFNDDCSLKVETWHDPNPDYQSTGYVYLIFNGLPRNGTNKFKKHKIKIFEGDIYISKDLGKALNKTTKLPLTIKEHR